MTHSELSEALELAACERAAKNLSSSPSSDSTASSSSSSNSDDGQSTQSSTPPSVKGAALSWEAEGRAGACAATRKPAAGHTSQPSAAAPNQGAAVSAELRLHPRRTQPCSRADGKSQPEPCAPPSLVRQCERKGNFVESLVDTTSQMIEVIWPLSTVPCGRDSFGGKNLIGLRLFIQEVLRRSKTSYSTLQVALYYLVLIKPCIPKVDFTKEQLEDSHTARAMQCGRRMFLAALILASKYLQDRTYSARAWSKISGLSTAEINSNEIAFVTAVDWKLHIPEPLFQRWTDIVLKYSLSSGASQPQRPDARTSWRSIIAKLNPALDNVDASNARSPCASRPSPAMSMSPPPVQKSVACPPSGLPRASVPAAPKPEALEPNFSVPKENYKFPPISPKITQLPTPQMTPNSSAFCTPAVSAKGLCHERSMSRAMRHAQSVSMLRCTMEPWPCSVASLPTPKAGPCARRVGIVPAQSLVSSPESMISDTSSQSSRSSRSSSISSVASYAAAPPQPRRLAVQASRRHANRCAAGAAKDLPMRVRTTSPGGDAWSCANPFTGAAEMSYLRGQSEDSEAAAAVALQDLALAGAEKTCGARSVSPANSLRKRERPMSGAESPLQEEIQGLLRREGSSLGLSDLCPFAADDTVAATTFLLRPGNPLALSRGAGPVAQGPLAAAGSQTGSRKRVCCAGGS